MFLERLAATIAFNPDLVGLIPNVRIFEKVSQRPRGEDCLQYVFGSEDYSQKLTEVLQTFERCNEPKARDLAIYWDEGCNVTHIGRVYEDGVNVLSKWGSEGHVYLHPSLLVPFDYGQLAGFYRPPTL